MALDFEIRRAEYQLYLCQLWHAAGLAISSGAGVAAKIGLKPEEFPGGEMGVLVDAMDEWIEQMKFAQAHPLQYSWAIPTAKDNWRGHMICTDLLKWEAFKAKDARSRLALN